MDISEMTTKFDKHGMPQFKSTGRLPVEDGKEFDAKKAADMGVPKFGRVEIPLNGRYQLREYAAELQELADKLAKLSRELDADEVAVVMWAHREIVNTSNRLRRRRGTPKPQLGDK
jgi:hypothetical protein